MTTAVDTNVLVAVLKRDDPLNSVALRALGTAFFAGRLVVCGSVYAELLALPGRTEKFLDTFLSDTQVDVEWTIDEAIWRAAGRAFSKYAARRRKNRSGVPRRILADFLIGAHASENGYKLLTLDARLYRSAFPKLKLVQV